MNRLLIPAAFAAIVLVAQGCASGTWVKPGADNAAVTRDMEECRKLALFRAPPPVAPTGTADARTGGGPVGAMTPAMGSNERFLNEHEEVRNCMLRKGYTLQRSS